MSSTTIRAATLLAAEIRRARGEPVALMGILEEGADMADLENRSECYEAASRLEHDFAPLTIAWGAAFVAAVLAVVARVGGAVGRAGGSTRRARADGAHRSVTRST